MSSLPLPIAAFLAGLISFLSPCVLPLVPGYVSMISGVGIDDLKSAQGQLMRRVMINSIGFIVGFSVVFVTLGAAATEIGQSLGVYKHTLARLAGLVIIVFGLHLTGIFKIKWLYADARLHNVKGNSTPFGAFVIGFAFAFGWTPCLGPILSAILTIAGQQDTVGKGIILLSVYSLGLAVPFLLTSLLMERFLKFYSRFRSYMHAIEVASGGLMIALGVLLLVGRFTMISNWLSFLGRFEVWLEGAITQSSTPAIVLLAIAIAVAIYMSSRKRSSAEGVVVKRNPLVLVLVAVLVAGMLYLGLHFSRRTMSAMPKLTQSSPAPDFSLESLDGSSIRLSDLKGKAVLLNFWATWCGPCKVEMPWFVELQKQYGPQGLQIVGVAMDDASKEDIAKFAKEMGVNYPILLGKEAVGDLYGGVPALPESFFISRDGKIVDKIFGLKGKGEIEDDIRKALNTQGSQTQTAASREDGPALK